MLAISGRHDGRLLDRRGLRGGLPVGLLLLAFIAVVHFGRRRSNTLEVMSGTGDERVRSLYTRAVALRRRRDGLPAAGLVARDGRPGRPRTRRSAILWAIFGADASSLAPSVRAARGRERQFVRSTQ